MEDKEKVKKELLALIMRQTNYDEEKTRERLYYWKYNVINVIKEYLNPNFTAVTAVTKEDKSSLNQKIIGEILKFYEEA